ncbi:hypothetical protein QOT17_011431 [Balamuthia mandrillaris]
MERRPRNHSQRKGCLHCKRSTWLFPAQVHLREEGKTAYWSRACHTAPRCSVSHDLPPKPLLLMRKRGLTTLRRPTTIFHKRRQKREERLRDKCQQHSSVVPFSNWQPHPLLLYKERHPNQPTDCFSFGWRDPHSAINERTATLALHEAMAWGTYPPTTSASDQEEVAGRSYGFVLRTGGAIWGLDWAPAPSNAVASTPFSRSRGEKGVEEKGEEQEQEDAHEELLVVAVNNPCTATGNMDLEENEEGEGEGEKAHATLQIWGIPRTQMEAIHSSCPSLPVLHFTFECGDVGISDVKWCPNTHQPAMQRLGVLAVANEDGSIKIYSVPTPCSLAIPAQGKEPSEPRHIALRPDRELRLPHNMPIRSLDWSPAFGHSLLLAGCSDGHVAVWDLALPAAAPPIFYTLAQRRAITRVRWHPFDANIFVSAGQSGWLKLWDLRNPYTPVYTYMAGGGWVSSLLWHHSREHPFVFFSSDTSIRYVDIDEMKATIVHSLSQLTWDMDATPWLNYLAFCSADGSLRLWPIAGPIRSKGKLKDFSLLTTSYEMTTTPQRSNVPSEQDEPSRLIFRAEDATLERSWKTDDHQPTEDNEQEEAEEGTEDTSSNGAVTEAPFAPPLVGLHRLCWNTNPGAEALLACGGAAGLLFCFAVPGLL